MAISEHHIPNTLGNRIAASLHNLAISQQQRPMRGQLMHRNTGYVDPRTFDHPRAFNGYSTPNTPGSTYTAVTEDETPKQYIIPYALLHRLVTQNSHALRNSLHISDTRSVLEGPTTVVIDGDVIGCDPTGATTFIDGTGKVLLPGLIDCHLHIIKKEEMIDSCNNGITTCMGMEEFPPAALAKLREAAKALDIRSAGLAAHFDPKGKPPPGLDTDPIQAAKWVDDQVQNGSDYIKIIIDTPDVDPQTLKALVDAAHAQGLKTISHCVWQGTYEPVMDAGVDMTAHTPLGEVLEDSVVRAMQTKKIPAIPTLIMMR